MVLDEKAKQLWFVRILLFVPLYLLLQWAFIILTNPTVFYSGWWLPILLLVAFFSIVLIIFIVKAQIPEFQDTWNASYFVEDLEEQEKVYVIPSRCSHCQTPIELDRVQWKDSYTLYCQECQLEIKIRLMEK